MDVVSNYWAVLAAGLSAMVIGYLWYGPLFGKPWAKEVGLGSVDMTNPAMKKKAMLAYPRQFVGSLVMAFVFAHIMFAFIIALGEEPSFQLGLQGAFWSWLGFIVPVKYGETLWTNKGMKLFWIDSGYYLFVLAVMSVVLVAWR